MVLLIGFEVLGKVLDALGEQGDLPFCAARIGGARTVRLEDLVLGLFCSDHGRCICLLMAARLAVEGANVRVFSFMPFRQPKSGIDT